LFCVLLDEGVELPWDNYSEEDWWIEQCGFKPTFYPFASDGNYTEGVSYNDPKVDAYYAEKQAFKDSMPVMPFDTVNICSGDYPMWILAVPGTLISCSRGYPNKFNPSEAFSAVDASGLIAFCEKYGIEYNEPPAWYLSSYWG